MIYWAFGIVGYLVIGYFYTQIQIKTYAVYRNETGVIWLVFILWPVLFVYFDVMLFLSNFHKWFWRIK